MEKWQRLLEQAKTAAKAAQTILDGAGDRALSDDERTAFQAKYDEAAKFKADSEQAKKDAESQAILKSLAAEGGDAPEDQGGPLEVNDRGDAYTRKSFGEAFVKSAAYQEFRKEHASGVGRGTPVNIGRVKVGSLEDWHGGRKATIGSPVGRVQNVRMPTISLVDQNRLTLLDLIDRGETAGNFEYVQITGVTRNAAVVPESTGPADAAALKPLSDMTTALADAKVYTYADGYDVTNQLLSDAPAFATYMNSELSYSLDNVVEEKLLNGTGVSGEPRGILTTSGVQQIEYDDDTAATKVMNFIKAVRRAITAVTRLPGGTVTGIVLSPEMDEAVDLLQDTQGRFYGQGPFGSGPGTLWGRPRVTSERIHDDEALLGDFKQVALLDREGLSILAFNQHKDYAQRNMTYVRAELRAAQVIWKPNRLAWVKRDTV